MENNNNFIVTTYNPNYKTINLTAIKDVHIPLKIQLNIKGKKFTIQNYKIFKSNIKIVWWNWKTANIESNNLNIKKGDTILTFQLTGQKITKTDMPNVNLIINGHEKIQKHIFTAKNTLTWTVTNTTSNNNINQNIKEHNHLTWTAIIVFLVFLIISWIVINKFLDKKIFLRKK